jgi:hypothetical protein
MIPRLRQQAGTGVGENPLGLISYCRNHLSLSAKRNIVAQSRFAHIMSHKGLEMDTRIETDAKPSISHESCASHTLDMVWH